MSHPTPDVEEGGETAFHWEGPDGPARPLADGQGCGGVGFKVAPRKGDALLFYSLEPDLKVDHRSLHGSCPVIKGAAGRAAMGARGCGRARCAGARLPWTESGMFLQCCVAGAALVIAAAAKCRVRRQALLNAHTCLYIGRRREVGCDQVGE